VTATHPELPYGDAARVEARRIAEAEREARRMQRRIDRDARRVRAQEIREIRERAELDALRMWAGSPRLRPPR
jgi:vacuolar-type H+-ATPase subunit H